MRTRYVVVPERQFYSGEVLGQHVSAYDPVFWPVKRNRYWDIPEIVVIFAAAIWDIVKDSEEPESSFISSFSQVVAHETLHVLLNEEQPGPKHHDVIDSMLGVNSAQ